MHRKIIVVITVLLMIGIGASASVAYATDDDLYKNLEETAQESKDDYFINYRGNYELDTEEMSFFKTNEAGSVILNIFSNFTFLLQKMLATLTISIFSFAQSTNISEIFGEVIEPFILAMKSSLWDSLAIYAIAFAAFVLLLKMAQNRTSQALSSLVGMILIIVMAFMFYAYPIQMLKGIDTVTTGISDAIMEGPYQTNVGGPAVDAKGKSAALCWNLFVHKPWQVLEFGSVSTAQKYEADILKLNPGSEEREELVKKLVESEGLFSKGAGYQFLRLITSIIIFVFNLMLMLVLITFSALILGFRVLVLIYLLLGIFVFLVALLPNFGLILVRRWGMRVISISFTRVMVVFFLSVILIFMDVMYKFIDEYGLLLVMFVILITTAALWFERYKLLRLFATCTSKDGQMSQMMNKGLDMDLNTLSAYQKTRQNLQNQDYSQVVNKVKAPIEYVKSRGTQVMEYKQSKNEEFSQSVKEYAASSKEVLDNHYSYLKSKAGEYDSFVNRTDKARKEGNGRFDHKDLVQMMQIMNRVTKQGLSTEDISYDGKKFSLKEKEKEVRPQSLASVSMEKTADFVNKVKTPRKTGIEYFKTSYGEEKGEEIYNNMSEKYGKDVVDSYSPKPEPQTETEAQPKGKNINNKEQKEKEDKLSYAQIMKDLKKNAETKQSKTPQEPSKIRKGEGQHGKQ